MTSPGIRWLILAALGFGVLCRVVQYGANTSLWHDESFVALISMHTDWHGLFGTLDWNEASPPGFLALEKLVSSVAGVSEYSLRLIPQLAGMAALLAFAGLARRLTGSAAAWAWAVILFAISDRLIEQANEVKHFSLDLLCAVAITWCAVSAWHRPQPRGVLLAWGASAAVALWLSYASIFVFAGTSMVLSVRARSGWTEASRRTYVSANVAVLLSFAALLVPIHLQRTSVLVDFWAERFPDTGSVWKLGYWLVRAYLGLFHYLPEPVRTLAPILTSLGALAYWQTGRRPELLLLGAPLLLCFVASWVRCWPFGGNQHMAFAAPLIILAAATGAERVQHRLSRWHPRAPSAFVALLLLPGMLSCMYHLAVPRRRHEMRPAIEFMQRHFAPGDGLLVLDPATFAFYTGRDVRKEPRDASPRSRLWVITPWSGNQRDPAYQIVATLRQRRPSVATEEVYGAAAFLFGPESEAPGP